MKKLLQDAITHNNKTIHHTGVQNVDIMKKYLRWCWKTTINLCDLRDEVRILHQVIKYMINQVIF